MQEAEDHAFGNERGEFVLVIAAARNDDREIRELPVDLGDEILGVVVGERGIDQQHRVAGRDHEIRRVCRVVCAPDAVRAGERFAQKVDQRRIGREHDDIRAARPRLRLGRCAVRRLDMRIIDNHRLH